MAKDWFWAFLLVCFASALFSWIALWWGGQERRALHSETDPYWGRLALFFGFGLWAVSLSVFWHSLNPPTCSTTWRSPRQQQIVYIQEYCKNESCKVVVSKQSGWWKKRLPIKSSTHAASCVFPKAKVLWNHAETKVYWELHRRGKHWKGSWQLERQ